jgi:hypothetical protein
MKKGNSSKNKSKMLRDLRKLAKATIKACHMPLEGKRKWDSDVEYMAEYLAPLAAGILKKYTQKSK